MDISPLQSTAYCCFSVNICTFITLSCPSTHHQQIAITTTAIHPCCLIYLYRGYSHLYYFTIVSVIDVYFIISTVSLKTATTLHHNYYYDYAILLSFYRILHWLWIFYAFLSEFYISHEIFCSLLLLIWGKQLPHNK